MVYEEGDSFIALPLLVRTMPPHLAPSAAFDATSVYGYAGPVYSDPGSLEALGERFRTAFSTAMEEQRAVTVFSRLHPLLPHNGVLDGLGERRLIGRTVSIDLTMSTEERRRRYRSNHRRDIRGLIRSGVRCLPDPKGNYLDDFERIYKETMARVSADESYFFDSAYFQALGETGSTPPLLLACVSEQRVVCAGIFLREGKTVQYHLSGTASNFYGKGTLKLLIDYASDWFQAQGAVILHLVGGIGGREDGLFHFKRGFSDALHDFWVWRWVVNPDIYATLPTGSPETEGFFPKYRIR